MKRFILIIISSLIFGGVWFASCSSENMQSVITYPQTGSFGLNILADNFVDAKKTEWGRFEYSVRAELSANSHLKIVIKSAKNAIDIEWGGWNQGSEKKWIVSNVGSQFTCTVYESGKNADASVIFTDDCIIEYYENGDATPTKTKQIKVIQ